MASLWLFTGLPFPQELIDQVIDHLRESPRDLASCSLVCRAWLPRTRSHLFRTLTITPQNLNSLLLHATAPRAIFTHVRGIAVGGDWPASAGSPPPHDGITTPPHDAITALIHRISAHTTIVALRLHMRARHLPAYHAAGGPLAHITDLVLRVSDHLEGVAHEKTIALICEFQHLRRLSLNSCALGIAAPEERRRLSPHVHTLALSLQTLTDAFLAWIARQTLPELHTICVTRLTRSQRRTLCAFLRSRGTSLRRLYVPASLLPHLDLASNSRLSTLHLIVDPPTSVADIAASLQPLAHSLMHTTTIEFDFTRLTSAFLRAELARPTWGTLDTALMAFPTLTCVYIIVPQTNAPTIRQLLPACDTYGTLVFAQTPPGITRRV